MLRRTILFLAVIATAFLFIGTLAAQSSGGQFCVRAFEDRNGNGTRDPGEPPLTRGISINLVDTNNVIINSALIEDSPNAASGYVCFQYLPTAQYTITISSVNLTPTTLSSSMAAITETSVEVFDFGAQRLAVESGGSEDTSAVSDFEQQRLLEGLFFAALGAMLAAGFMIIIGMVLYFTVFRNRGRRQPDVRRTTGSMPMVPVDDTGRFRPPPSDGPPQ